MSKDKLIPKMFRIGLKDKERLAWLVKDSGINSESAYLRYVINRLYKEEQGFLEYLKEKENNKD